MRALLLLSLVGVTVGVVLLTATQCAHADDAADESKATDDTAASTLDNEKVAPSSSNDGDDSKLSKLGKRDGVEIQIETRGKGQQNNNRDKSDDHSDNNNNNQNNYQNNNDNNHNNDNNNNNDYNNNKNRKNNDNDYNNQNNNNQNSNNNDNDGWRDGDDDNSNNNNKHESYQSEEAKPVRPYNEPKPVYVEKKVVYEKEEPVRPYQQPVKVYQEEKKVYVQSSNAYENGPSHSGLAEVIPASQSQQTLDQIYKKQPQNAYERPKAYLAYQSASQNNIPQNVRQDILLLLKFPRDFDQWNPRNNNSQWQWGGSPNDPQDNAAFVVHNGNQYSSSARNNYDGGNKYKTEYNAYGKQTEQPVYKKKDDSYVDLISVPFNRFTPQNDPYNEAAVVSKAFYTIGDRQRFLARLKFSCHIVNADQHPFPANLVANPWDDPRLANCFFSLHAPLDDNTTLLFYIEATNTGVWAVTERAGNNGSTSNAQEYIAKRRVGVRPRYDSLVDAAIEVDRLQSVVNFYLNGYRVWTVYTIGVPPSADGITSVNLGQGTPTIATVTSVQVAFGTAKCPDEVDPNNQASRTRLINVLGADSLYYGANDTFYDNEAQRNNQIFGQGASERLFKLLLVRADSVLPAQIALPGVYGPKAPEYQQYNNEYRHENNNNNNNNDEYIRKK